MVQGLPGKKVALRDVGTTCPQLEGGINNSTDKEQGLGHDGTSSRKRAMTYVRHPFRIYLS